MARGCSVEELLATEDSRSLAEWMAYSIVEPFGEFRQDLRVAMLWCVMANANRDTKKHPNPFTISDFLNVFEIADMPNDDELVQKMENNLKRYK